MPKGTTIKGASAIGKSEVLNLIKTQLQGTLLRAADTDTYTKGTDPTGPVNKYTKGGSARITDRINPATLNPSSIKTRVGR